MFNAIWPIYAVLVVAIFTGWVLNVVQVIHLASAPITGIFVLKCIGIPVVPFGAILGWVGLA